MLTRLDDRPTERKGRRSIQLTVRTTLHTHTEKAENGEEGDHAVECTQGGCH